MQARVSNATADTRAFASPDLDFSGGTRAIRTGAVAGRRPGSGVGSSAARRLDAVDHVFAASGHGAHAMSGAHALPADDGGAQDGRHRVPNDRQAPPTAHHQKSPSRREEPRSHRSARSTAREITLSILIPVLIVILIRLFVADIYVIPSGSMLDTLQIGDRIVTSRIEGQHGQIHRGDIIVFKDPDHWLSGESSGGILPNDYLVKRVIGLPGDTVACKGAGSKITINGHPIDETSYLRPGVDPSDIAFSVKVTSHHLFVMGDNRSNSADSRYHLADSNGGLVPVSDVQGVAKFVYWPFTHWRGLGRDDSVYAGVGGVPSAR